MQMDTDYSSHQDIGNHSLGMQYSDVKKDVPTVSLLNVDNIQVTSCWDVLLFFQVIHHVGHQADSALVDRSNPWNDVDIFNNMQLDEVTGKKSSLLMRRKKYLPCEN
jgi:hypothetical protein